MNDDLLLALFEAGLIQYGLFGEGEPPRPFQHQLAMLASYPALLRQTARALGTLARGVDRLLCAEAAIPLATAIALETGLPLVIGRGEHRDGARDLIGAFDIGHPAALITLALDELAGSLIHHAHRFGLEVVQTRGVLTYAPQDPTGRTIALAEVGEITRRLVALGRLPPGIGRMVDEWLATRPRPDSAGP